MNGTADLWHAVGKSPSGPSEDIVVGGESGRASLPDRTDRPPPGLPVHGRLRRMASNRKAKIAMIIAEKGQELPSPVGPSPHPL